MTYLSSFVSQHFHTADDLKSEELIPKICEFTEPTNLLKLITRQRETLGPGPRPL